MVEGDLRLRLVVDILQHGTWFAESEDTIASGAPETVMRQYSAVHRALSSCPTCKMPYHPSSHTADEKCPKA